MSEERTVRVGEDHDGQPVELPVVELLTGRGFVTGKSGSGKSNTASVIAEELLEEGYPLLIVDTDGEYYGLKEEYELLHAGADEECDIQIGPEHAEKIARLALEENVPVVLDVSGYLDDAEADELIRRTARQLFAKEKKLKKPFLLVVEEIHEYVPEGAGLGDTGQMLIKVGKRGRKHGLGIVGISQRPADVKKDFITQANWLVWHRLTWENDTKVVGRIVGNEYADAAPELDDGQAFVQRDWTDEDVSLVQFDRKRTFDAGATPGLDDVDRPELKSVSDTLVSDLQEITAARDRERDRIEELEAELEAKNEEIADLEEELRAARNVSQAAKRMADALTDHVPQNEEPYGYEERLRQKNRRIDELSAKLEEREQTSQDLRAGTESDAAPDATADSDTGGGLFDLAGAGDEDDSYDTGQSPTADTSDTESETPGTNGLLDGLPQVETADETGTSEVGTDDGDSNDGGLFPPTTAGGDSPSSPDRSDDSDEASALAPPSVLDTDANRDVDEHVARLREKGERLLAADGDSVRWQQAPDPADVVGLLTEEAIVERVDGAIRASQVNDEHGWSIVAAITARGGISLGHLDELLDVSVDHIESVLSELRDRDLVVRDGARRYAIAEESMREMVGTDELPIDDPGRQWAVDG